ncbi:hypothetical protein B2J88_24950 [Rhodococcus sp. SRB_17]|nr:hypothetical protein [Rhodococcus sp. SRB_17]
MTMPDIPATLAALAVSGARHGDFPAFRHRGPDGLGGDWHDVSYLEADELIQRTGAGLVAMGIAPGDRIAIFADSQTAWTVADMAIFAAGAATVPVFSTSTAAEVDWVLRDSGTSLVFVDNTTTAEIVDSLGLGLTVIGLHPGLVAESIEDVAARGDDATHRAELLARAKAVTPNDVASVVYTSGTTSKSKGCTLTHDNLRGVYAGLLAYKMVLPGETAAVFLPQAHLFARVVVLCCYAYGSTVAYVSKDPQQMLPDLGEIKPHYIPAVPRIFEKLYSAVHADPTRSHQDRLAMTRAMLGGRVRQFSAGGAPIDLKILEFFHEAGVPVLEGFGLTEGGGVVTNSATDAFKLGSVGRALPGFEIKISREGELLVGGVGVFAGYQNNPEATAAALRDGWLHTGDLGSIDEDGYLTITGRIKDLIITSGGKNIAPTPIEHELSRHPLVSQGLVVGDRRPFCSALFTLSPAAVEHYEDPAREIEQIIETVNETLPGYSQIRKWQILPEELSIDAGTLTATQKIRRSAVLERYADLIDTMYANIGRPVEVH